MPNGLAARSRFARPRHPKVAYSLSFRSTPCVILVRQAAGRYSVREQTAGDWLKGRLSGSTKKLAAPNEPNAVYT